MRFRTLISKRGVKVRLLVLILLAIAPRPTACRAVLNARYVPTYTPKCGVEDAASRPDISYLRGRYEL